MEDRRHKRRPGSSDDTSADTPRGSHHRRALSDMPFRFDDLLLFDPSDLDLTGFLDTPATLNPNPPRVTTTSSDDNNSSSNSVIPLGFRHLRSLSVDSDFMDALGGGGPIDDNFGGTTTVATAAAGEERVVRHRHSYSMDEVESLTPIDDNDSKKAVAAERLAELALIDPRRAKRILANRKSAARSKERKTRYTNDLEVKVQTLQAQATNLSAQLTILQRDTSGLTTENRELKLRLEAMEQQTQLRNALSEALKEEVQRLRLTASQMAITNGSPFGQFACNPHAMHNFGNRNILGNRQ
ncbi:hypothetical protein ACFE04_025917 [Oxalis oulophora]